MPEFVDIFVNSFNLIFSLNPDLLEIIFLSLKISFFSLLFSCLFGLPLGALLAVTKFTGRKFSLQNQYVLFNSF